VLFLWFRKFIPSSSGRNVVSSAQIRSYDCKYIIRYEMSRAKTPPLTSAQIRAARALVRWSAEDLARASALGIATIRRAELTEGQTSLTVANDSAIRQALEAVGVVFIPENGGGVGVRLRERGQGRR
jgi:hypothetical protein